MLTEDTKLSIIRTTLILYFVTEEYQHFANSNSCNTSDGYNEFNRGNCYKIISELKTFSEAESACEDDGGHLVTIQDEAENQFLLTFTASDHKHWIGLTDRDQEGDFQWLNGSERTFVKWAPGEPNNIDNEDCGALWTSGQDRGTWNDYSCAIKIKAICEKKCMRPELSSSYDISGLEDTSSDTCVTLQKPTLGEPVTFVTFNDSYPCKAAPRGVMKLEVMLDNGQQCGALIDLFYMYHEIHTPGSCYGNNFIKACDLISSETDLSPCRLNCRCTEKCYGTVLASDLNNFEQINLCGILVL